MAINYYVGVEGPSIEGINSAQDLYDALNVLHTMVIGSMESCEPDVDGSLLNVLSDAMERIMREHDDVEPT